MKTLIPKGKIKKDVTPSEESVPSIVEETTPAKEVSSAPREKAEGRRKRVCHFCSSKTQPRYFDAVTLRRCLNDRGRIVARTRSGACSKHQRAIAREIKRARHLALLPFTVRV